MHDCEVRMSSRCNRRMCQARAIDHEIDDDLLDLDLVDRTG